MKNTPLDLYHKAFDKKEENLTRQLEIESKVVQQESMKVSGEFEMLDDGMDDLKD